MSFHRPFRTDGPSCTRGPWGFSDTQGSGVAPGTCVLSAYCLVTLPSGRRVFRHGQLTGRVVPAADRTALAMLYGFLQPYGRNVCNFVMSRAARRRGLTTADTWYHMRKDRHAERLEMERAEAAYDKICTCLPEIQAAARRGAGA